MEDAPPGGDVLRREIIRLKAELTRGEYRERALEATTYASLAAVDVERQRLATQLQQLREECDARDADYESLKSELDREVQALASARDRLVAERQALRHEIDDLKRSRSWRITAPLRRAGAVARAIMGNREARR